MRLRTLSPTNVSLEGSADGFLTAGWTALTSLSFSRSCAAKDNMSSALELPALEMLRNRLFRHRGGVLQLDQLTRAARGSPTWTLAWWGQARPAGRAAMSQT